MGGRELVHLTVVSLFSKKRRERREVRENRVRSYERSNERMIGNSIKKKEFKWYFIDFWENSHMDQSWRLGRNSSPSAGRVVLDLLFPLCLCHLFWILYILHRSGQPRWNSPCAPGAFMASSAGGPLLELVEVHGGQWLFIFSVCWVLSSNTSRLE